MTSFPYFSGASSCLASASHPCSNLFSPLSVVSSHASHRHLTSAFFSFSYFRGASLDFGAATHLGATCFPHFPGCHPMPHIGISPLHSSLSPISGVPSLTSGRRLTSGQLASPAFRGTRTSLACASHHTNISSPHFPGCSPLPYGSWASFPAELFLRSRECVEFPEKKVMWSAELSEEKG